MPTHDNGTVTLELTTEEARFLLQSIAATPLQGQLIQIAKTVTFGTSLMARIEGKLNESRPTKTPQGE